MNRIESIRFAGALLALTLCLNGCTSMQLVPGVVVVLETGVLAAGL